MRRREFCLLLASGLTLTSKLVKADRLWRLGILPIHNTRILVERFEPLRAYLEKTSSHPILVETASSFLEFHKRTLAYDYDLIVTPAHMARVAEQQAGWRPLIQLEPDHDSMILVRMDHPLITEQDMRNRGLAVVDRLAMTVAAAIEHLHAAGLTPDQDFTITEYRTHASVIYALLSGRAYAAVSTSQGLHQIPKNLRKKLTVFRHITDIPAFVIMARPGLPTLTVSALTQALLDLPRHPEGIELFSRTGYNRLHLADESAMHRADAYTRDLLRLQP